MYETDLSAIDIRGNYLYNDIVYIYVMGFFMDHLARLVAENVKCCWM